MTYGPTLMLAVALSSEVSGGVVGSGTRGALGGLVVVGAELCGLVLRGDRVREAVGVLRARVPPAGTSRAVAPPAGPADVLARLCAPADPP